MAEGTQKGHTACPHDQNCSAAGVSDCNGEQGWGHLVKPWLLSSILLPVSCSSSQAQDWTQVLPEAFFMHLQWCPSAGRTASAGP